jgi:hypothetical protein
VDLNEEGRSVNLTSHWFGNCKCFGLYLHRYTCSLLDYNFACLPVRDGCFAKAD